MRTILAIAAAGLVLVESSFVFAEEPDAQLAVHDVESIIREHGAAETLAQIRTQGGWRQLLDAIATGDPAWLDVASKLGDAAVTIGPHTDAQAFENMAAAMGEALRRKPAHVLARLTADLFRPEDVCGNCFPESSVRAADYKALLRAQEAAVAAVRDPGLISRRDSCLRVIRRRSR